MVSRSVLCSIGAAGFSGVVALAALTRMPWLQQYDDLVEARAEPHRLRWRSIAGVATLTGEKFVHPVIAAISALVLIHFRPGDPSHFLVPLGAASLGGITLHHLVKFIYHRHRPEGALRRNKTEAAYPSGHTTNATSVVATSALLLVHEHLVAAGVAIPILILLCLATGFSRVMLGWHWATDVLGGWMAGAGVASLAYALFLGM